MANEEPILLKSGVNFKGVEFEIDMDEVETEQRNNVYNETEVNGMLENLNLECLGLVEEEGYDDCAPFEKIAAKMENVDPNDERLKKRVIRQGAGDLVPLNSRITIHYQGYIEYQDEPYDSSYLRRRPHVMEVGSHENIIGLEKAVLTMRLNEKSHFLIHPDLAYGQIGCMDRIPGNATLLFEVEILKIVLAGSRVENCDDLSEDDKKKFANVYKSCLGLQMKGKEYFSAKSYRLAIGKYNTALARLEGTVVEDLEDQNKQDDLRLRLYTNLAICYNKVNLPKKACTACNRIFEMVKGTSFRVPVKVYFAKATALIAISEYADARRLLMSAKRMEPENLEISRKLQELHALTEKHKNDEAAIAKKMFNGGGKAKQAAKAKNEGKAAYKVSPQFRETMKEICQDLVRDKDTVQVPVATELTEDERLCLKEYAEEFGLEFSKFTIAGVDKYYVCKKKSAK